jgi:DNA repair exonuclease SbcCD ATPase subunit
MKLPTNTLPTRKLWTTLRDNAGGKSGMSKADVGPGLDAFHKAYETAQKKNDLGPLTKEITALTKTITTYINEVKKDNKKVADVAEDRIKRPLDGFKTEMANTAKEGNKDLNKQVGMLDEIIKCNKEADKVMKALAQVKLAITTIKESAKKEPNRKNEFLEKAKLLQKKALDYEVIANKLQSDFQTDVASVDVSIAESRKKELDEARETIRKMRLATLDNLSLANDLVKDLSK